MRVCGGAIGATLLGEWLDCGFRVVMRREGGITGYIEVGIGDFGIILEDAASVRGG